MKLVPSILLSKVNEERLNYIFGSFIVLELRMAEFSYLFVVVNLLDASTTLRRQSYSLYQRHCKSYGRNYKRGGYYYYCVE
jgi:hypothetical protein